MTITDGKTVAITYTLRLDNGEVVDSNVDQEPLSYVQGDEQLIFGLEQALVHGNRYGTSLSEVERARADGVDLLLSVQ